MRASPRKSAMGLVVGALVTAGVGGVAAGWAWQNRCHGCGWPRRGAPGLSAALRAPCLEDAPGSWPVHDDPECYARWEPEVFLEFYNVSDLVGVPFSCGTAPELDLAPQPSGGAGGVVTGGALSFEDDEEDEPPLTSEQLLELFEAHLPRVVARADSSIEVSGGMLVVDARAHEHADVLRLLWLLRWAAPHACGAGAGQSSSSAGTGSGAGTGSSR